MKGLQEPAELSKGKVMLTRAMLEYKIGIATAIIIKAMCRVPVFYGARQNGCPEIP